MPSFDVVSEVDAHELQNAIDQVNREIGTRFDFKGADAQVDLKSPVLTLSAQSDFQVKQIRPMLYERLAKRGIDVQCLPTDVAWRVAPSVLVLHRGRHVTQHRQNRVCASPLARRYRRSIAHGFS